MTKKLFSFYFLLTSFLCLSQESYYDGIDFLNLNGISLKNELSTRITSTHTNLLSYTPGVWEASKVTDASTNNTAQVTLIYGWEDGSDSDITNDKYRDANLQDNGSNGSFVWNREHVFSKSLGNPNLGTTGPGADAHHLRPADRSRNSERSNLPFASGSGNSGKVNSGTAWYPGDEWKGDVARMMMYMYVRYGDVCLPTVVGVGNSNNTPDDMIDLFLQWNIEDPVSDIEKIRNTYHENTSNTYAQGNRNPFIDNPYLATRIWGGNDAQDLWGIFIDGDSEAPSKPTNVIANNQTTTSINISWSASSDNVAVTGYNVYMNGNLKTKTNNTQTQITNLDPGTSYIIEIEATDQYNNKSEKSSPLTSNTLQDTTVPSTPTNIIASNVSGTGFKISWSASSDDTAVAGYELFVNGNLNTYTTNLSYTITGLTISTTYTITVLAKDSSSNESLQSTAINVTTTDGSSNGLTELFFSEYVEPNGGHNKALEIMNPTNDIISLSGYSIKKQTNGSGDWADELILDSGNVKNINANDVFVIINGSSDAIELINNADLNAPSSPLNFNGNDAIGLFKNGELIDIIGVFGSSSDYAKNMTLRRKLNVLVPNTTFTNNEWDTYPENTFEGIGNHNTTLSLTNFDLVSFKIYPNPINDQNLNISTNNRNSIVYIYNTLGKLIRIKNISKIKNSISLKDLPKGTYIIKIKVDNNKVITKKIVKI